MRETVCCPELRMSPCAESEEHQHINCRPKYLDTGELPNADWVKRVCIGNFRGCKYHRVTSRRNESGGDANMCCRHLQINEGQTNRHNHFACGPKYVDDQTLPTINEVSTLCLGDFRNCKSYGAEPILLEGTANHEN